jgi:phosphoribosylanthranilate isomerase
MQRRAYFEKKKAKKLSPYRRVQAQLGEALLAGERLRLVCVTQRMAHARIQEAHSARMLELIGVHNQRDASLCNALRDALAFFDRVNSGKMEWTAADVQRLAKLRKLAGI